MTTTIYGTAQYYLSTDSWNQNLKIHIPDIKNLQLGKVRI